MMKKFLIALLGASLSFSLVACGDDGVKDPNVEDNGNNDNNGGDQTNPDGNGNGGDQTNPDGNGNGGDQTNPDGNGGDEVSQGTVAAAAAATVGTTVTVEGVISAIVYGAGQTQVGCYITDSTGTLYMFGKDFAASTTVGDHVIITAQADVYKDVRQVKFPTLTTKVASGVEASVASAQKDKDFAWIKANLANLGTNTFEVNVSLVKDSNGNYKLEDANGNLFSLYSSGSNSTEFSYLESEGDNFTVVITVGGVTGSGDPRGQIIKIVK